MQVTLLTAALGAALLLGSQDEAPKAEQKGPEVPVPELPDFDTSDPAVHGKQLAEYADRFDTGWVDEYLKGRMTLFDAGGDSVERVFSRMVLERAKEGDKLILKFQAPAEIKGVAALTFENPGGSDDNWLYLPSTKRVRRISGANNTASFQGTEFTYEDLSSLDPREYEWRYLDDTPIERGDEKVEVHRLEARPTYADTGYQRLIVHFNKATWAQERVEYYDKSGTLLKTRESTEWKQYHKRFWRPQRFEMINHQTKKRTVLVTEKQALDLASYKSKKTGKPKKGLTESMFTTRELQK